MFKKIIITIIVISFFFSPIVFVNADSGSRRPISTATENFFLFFEKMTDSFMDLINNIVDEIEYRQKVIEDEVEQRRKNFINRMIEKISEFAASLVDRINRAISELFRSIFIGTEKEGSVDYWKVRV